MEMADFVNNESPVWNNVEYEDTDTQAAITRSVHEEMMEAGEVVHIPEDTTRRTAEAYPDLRGMKKADRGPVLREKMNQLKGSLRQFLNGLKGTNFEFEVNGNVLEARLYNTGIREVMEKINQDKASMLYHSDEIFKTAKYLYSTPDYSGDPNVYRWNYFYSPVQIGDETVGVRIAVRDMVPSADGRMDSQIYNWGIKKGPALGGGGPGGTPNTTDASSAGPSMRGSDDISSGATLGGDGPSAKPLSTDASSAAPTETIAQPTGDVNGEMSEKVQNGGLNDGEAAGGSVPSETGGREAGGPGRSGGDVVSDGGPERHVGMGPGEQTGSLGGGTGRARKAVDPGTAAIKRQALGKTLQGQKVSSRSLGIPSGTDAAAVTVIPESAWDEGLRNTARKVERETGKRTTFVLDRIPVTGADGKVRRVRGVNMADGIILQADNYGATVEQLADHEIFHDLAAENPGLVRTLEDRISEMMGRDELNRVIDAYMDALGGVYDHEAMTGEELERAYLNILEEIYADAYAGINAFGANAKQFRPAVEETLEDRGLGRRGRETGEATDRTTGPPSSRYSYGGRNANRADSESLAAAERLEMQGVEAEDIRQETGWFRGMDGKWRFEIDDSGMRYDAMGDVKNWRSYQRAKKEYTKYWMALSKQIANDEQREDIRRYMVQRENGEFDEGLYNKLTGELGESFERWAEANEAVIENKTDSTGDTLEDFLKHDELFQNYPQLRHMSLVFRDMEPGVKGYFDKRGGAIVLSESLRHAPEDTLIHEIQHAIQRAEDFARGASWEYWNRRLEEGYVPPREKARRERIEAAEQTLREIEATAPEGFLSRLREYQYLENYIASEKGVEDMGAWERAENIQTELEETYGELFQKWFDADWERQMAEGSRNEALPSDLYRDTAGEIEARDAAKRRSLTAEERRRTPPDLGDENTVFAEGDGESLSIGYDENNRPFVTVEEDILDGVPRDRWVRTVKDNLRRKFPEGVRLGRNTVRINDQSRREMTFSNYMRRLFKNDPQIYSDKLRATNNAGEILQATRDWVNEALLHPRKDAIIDFARGEVQLRVGGRDYTAQVIVGNKGGGGLLLYDIIELRPTTIQERTQKAGVDRFITQPHEGTGNSQSTPASADSITQAGGEIKGENQEPKWISLPAPEEAARPAGETAEPEGLSLPGPEEGKPGVRFSVDEDSQGRELTGEQAEYFKNSKVRDEKGRLLTLYHQTEGDFTVFDPRHQGAGSRDNITPFGIFLKTSDRDIGLRGKRQMELYANIVNPLRATDREDLARQLQGLSDEYTRISTEIADLDTVYHGKYEDAKKALRDFMTEWRRQNPDASRRALYDVPEFNTLYEAEDMVVDEWTAKEDELSKQAKEIVTATLQKAGYDGVILSEDAGSRGRSTDAYIALNPSQVKNVTNTTPSQNPDIRFSVDDSETSPSGIAEQREEKAEQQPKKTAKTGKKPERKPVAESKPIIAKRDLKKNLLSVFSTQEGRRAELGAAIDGFADRLLRDGVLTDQDREDLFNRLYNSGVVTEAADEYFQEGRNAVAGGRIYVNDIIKGDFGDDWNAFRRRAQANGVYLTNDQSDAGVDVWNQELGETLPGLFNQDELDGRAILERIVQVAEEGKDQKISLAEYTKQLAGEEYVSEREILDNMERQMDWALRTFAEKADLEIKLRDRTGVKIAQEREQFAESSRRQREREALRRGKEREQRRQMLERQRQDKALRELQQKTLKQLQWLSKNRYQAPEKLRGAWDQVLGDIDTFAVGAANEMNWSKKYEATWRDLAQMYQEAKKSDPNFLPSKDLERIVARLDKEKIADMDVSALQDLYKAAVGLRTEFYNRNKVIGDEERRLFAEVYKASKRDIEEAPESYTGKGLDKFVNLEQLTPMNVLERMGGWDPDGTFYSMAKQLEQGERDVRAYTVEAKRQIEDFLTKNQDWVKRADGQGKDAIWYELEVPELMKLGMGDKPIFGDTVKVYMTPAQKVHLFLESKSTDNLRHMTGGRTFVNRELYSQGKRAEALAQGVTVKLAPETVNKIVSDMTIEELALANALEQYYNGFAAERINKVSNTLYGYDKAVSRNYAPIFTNQNYTKSEIGVFDATAEGVGHLKGRQYAVNPSYNISAFDAFERHVDQTSRFVGMAIPARNWQTLLNWREENNSTGDVITHKWGQEGKQYIENLLTELQGGKKEEKSSAEKLIDTTLSNYISSVFGANPSIVFKQAMSFPLAGTYLGWENMPNLQKALATDDGLINTYTSELAYRLMGYATPETAQLKNNPSKLSENKFLKFTFGGGAITTMDGWTVKSIWRWAENAVRRDNPDLEMGTAEQIEAGQSPFYQEVARRFEEAVSRSQPMYDVMHRSAAMRSSSGIARALTLFKTVPQQQYNMLRQTVAEARRAKERYGAKSEAYSAARKKAGRTVQGVILAGLGIEAINFLNAMLKNGAKRYKDDEEEEITWASFGKQFLQGFMADNMGMMIGGDLVAELLGSAVTGEKWYGIETPGITQIQDVLEEFLSGCKNIQKLTRDGYGIAKNGGDLKEYFRRHGADYLGALEEGLRTVAKYFGGIPADNIRGYALGALRWISPEMETAYQDWLKTADKDGLKGLKGEALETRVYDILKNRIGSAEEETAMDLSALYGAGYKAAIPSDTPESITVDSESRKLNAFQKQLYDRVWKDTVGGTLDEVVASGAFQEADQETQAKMLRDLYSYAGELAKAEVFDDYPVSTGTEKTKEILKSGLDMADYLALKETGGVDRYLKAAGKGLEAEDAAQAALTVSEIREEAKKTEKETEKKVPNLTLYREVLRETRDTDAQIAALALLMSEGEYARLEAGVYRGITPEMYVTAKESIAEIDKNGSVSQDEAARAIGLMPGLTDEERAVLWQLQNKSWKPGKNPFSVKAGEKVYKDLQTGGGTLEGPEKEQKGLELPRLE